MNNRYQNLSEVELQKIKDGIAWLKTQGATFDYAYWLERDSLEGLAYLVGKRRAKLYLAGKRKILGQSGNSYKDTSYLIAEVSLKDESHAFDVLATALNLAKEKYEVINHTTNNFGMDWHYKWIEKKPLAA